MIKRKGFRNFIRTQEGKDIFVAKDYGYPKDVFKKAPVNWQEDSAWVMSTFIWDSTPQGSVYWGETYSNGWSEESKDIIRTWISQGYL